jgi:hypothetical protein
MRRCVVEDDAAVRGNDRVGQERHRSVISGDDAVAWNVVTALSNPLGHAGDVDRGLLETDLVGRTQNVVAIIAALHLGRLAGSPDRKSRRTP